jgi:hypothetical protein
MLCGGPHVMIDRLFTLPFMLTLFYFEGLLLESNVLFLLEVKAKHAHAGFNPPNDQPVALKHHV